jgi:branched-subunit amino acid ABC-type transport system permease component
MTHIVADFAIFGAYSTIPLVLAYFVIRRRDVPFVPVFWLFVAFILFCGLGHFVEGLIFWQPVYRFSALIKVCTATVSWITVLALLPTLPKALALPKLATINQQLVAEMEARRHAEDKLQKSYDELQDFTRVVLDREDRVIDLKHEVNGLLRELGHSPRYSVEIT